VITEKEKARCQAGLFEFGLGRTQIFAWSVPECKDHTQLNEPTYGKRLHAAARKDFKAYWSAHRWWASGVTLIVASLAIVIQIVYQGAGSMANLEQTAVTGIIGLAVSLVGNYLISMRRGAEALDIDRISEIEKRDTGNREILEASAAQSSELRRKIEQLTPPKRTPAEQHAYDAATAALKEFGESRRDIEKALRHLRMRETWTYSSAPVNTSAPEGMTIQDFRVYLNLCAGKSLVTVNQGEKHQAGSYWVYDEVFSIAPGMKAALDELLYTPVQS
jgi:hypothetical protein